MKQFLCKWGEGYYREEERVLNEEDIVEEYGWDKDYINRVLNAEIGDLVDCSDYSGILLVKRIS